MSHGRLAVVPFRSLRRVRAVGLGPGLASASWVGPGPLAIREVGLHTFGHACACSKPMWELQAEMLGKTVSLPLKDTLWARVLCADPVRGWPHTLAAECPLCTEEGLQ